MTGKMEMLSAAPEAPAPEPVAWSFEFHDKLARWKREVSSYKPSHYDGYPVRNVRPLYAHPAPEATAPVVRVKPLEWEFDGAGHIAKTDRDTYYVCEVAPGAFSVSRNGRTLSGDFFPTLSVALPVAQADHEHRIRSALDIQPTDAALAAARAEGKREGWDGVPKEAADVPRGHPMVFAAVREAKEDAKNSLSTLRQAMQERRERERKADEGRRADEERADTLADHERHTLSQAAIDVIAERRRQVEAEGWTPEHDDEHGRGEMAIAAGCYALYGTATCSDHWLVRYAWPWASKWWKPKDRRHDLVRAGALILAEIERLDRASERSLLKEEVR